MRNVIALLLFASTVGCGPLALQHGARTVAKGKVAAGASGLIIHEVGQGDAKDSSNTQVGQGAAFIRWGFHQQIDAGLQVYPGGMRGDVKLQMVDTEGVAVSVSPGLHFGYYDSFDEYSDEDFGDGETTESGTLTGLDFTFVVAKKMGDGEAWVAPRFGSFSLKRKYRDESDEDTFEDESTLSYRGWGLGFGAKVRMTETVWLVPELGIYQRETKSQGFTSRGVSWVPAIGFATGF